MMRKQLVLVFLFCLAFSSMLTATNITGVWANEGADKVTQDELRVSSHRENATGLTKNRTWDGSTITVFGAHNETVSFSLILEAGTSVPASNVSVSFDTLTGPNGASIRSVPASGDSVFNWVGRNIELFYTRYLKIEGLSVFGYGKWDERLVPVRFQLPHTDTGKAQDSVGWYDRPDHDKYYPDPLVPLELVQQFNIAAGHSQAIWCDIYIPKTVPSGLYTGTLTVSEDGVETWQVPVKLSVYQFTLPDSPSAKTMAAVSTSDILYRYISAGAYRNWASADGQAAAQITDRYFQLFHRHRIALIGENECQNWDRPCESSIPRLDGSLYTADRGYDGPGVGVPAGVFSIGTYGTWRGAWGWGQDEPTMWAHADAWTSWFQQNLPGTDFFLYLEDEPQPSDFQQNQTWAQWLRDDPGPGHNLMSLVTKSPVVALSQMPSVSIPVMPADTGWCSYPETTCDNTAEGKAAAAFYKNTAGYKYWAYNDGRPSVGSSMTEDDGVAFRSLPWAQTKMGIGNWFYWYVNPDGQANLFQDAVTFGSVQYRDPSIGMTGYQASNGTGLLVYPGTDLFNPQDSYGVKGPIASVRLKEWRRGIQDADYLALAQQVDASATKQILNNVLPQTMWEIKAPDPNYYTGGGPSFSSDPDVWESARAQLAVLIAKGCSSGLLSDAHACSSAIPVSQTTAGESGLPLTIQSSVPGARFTMVGPGCPTGFYDVPSTVGVSNGSLCLIVIIPPAGFTFSGWSDQQPAQSGPRAIVMSPQISTLNAEFFVSTPAVVPITLTASLPGLTIAVAGDGCSSGNVVTPVTLALSQGLQCTFTPVVPAGYQFAQWSTGSTLPALHLTVQGGTSLNATFNSATQTSPAPTGGLTAVSVTSNSNGASVYVFGQGCSAGLYALPTTLSIQPGTPCMLAAVAPAGLNFLTWSDGFPELVRNLIIGPQPINLEADFQ